MMPDAAVARVVRPARIRRPRVSDVNTVTSDMLPTLCELAGQPLPKRKLDGISLVPLLDDNMLTRPKPIGLWNGRPRSGPPGKPYIDPELQKGTTPVATLSADGFTRNFRNHYHSGIIDEDFNGPRAMLDNRYKLVINGGQDTGKELFDVRADPAENMNVIKEHPQIAAKLEQQLLSWQQSVLESLSGADYP